MRPLRTLALRRAWAKLGARPRPRPDGPMQWGAEMRALVLFDRDDPRQVKEAESLALADLGVDASLPGSQGRPELLGWTSTPATKTAEEATPASASATEATPLDTWTPKQLAFSGVAKAEVAAAVLAKAYDLVVCLQPSAFAPFDYLAAGAKAHLRVARHDEAGEVYDAMDAYDVVIRAKPARFVPELRAYLRALNPKL